MKYYLRNSTLFIRGTFRAASTGPQGGIGDVPTLLECSVKERGKITDEQVIENRASEEGLSRDCFGLVSETGVQNLSILQYDFITVFILIGPRGEPVKTEDSVHIIIYSGEGFSDAALLGALITGTEAKTEALSIAGPGCSGFPGDRMIVASEGPVIHTGADSRTEAGKKSENAFVSGFRGHPERRDRETAPPYMYSAGLARNILPNGPRNTARIIPAILKASAAITVTARFTPAGTRNSASMLPVRTAGRSGTAVVAGSFTSRELPDTSEGILRRP